MKLPTDQFSALLDALQALLEEERGVLLAGRPERIAAVAARKLALADEIERHVAGLPEIPSGDRLARLARCNRQNGVICSAMLRHMLRALDRLRAQEPHRSYRPDGSERERSLGKALGAA